MVGDGLLVEAISWRPFFCGGSIGIIKDNPIALGEKAMGLFVVVSGVLLEVVVDFVGDGLQPFVGCAILNAR